MLSTRASARIRFHHLSTLAKRTIHAVRVESDLRVLFTIIGDVILTIDVGTHDIYKS